MYIRTFQIYYTGPNLGENWYEISAHMKTAATDLRTS
jgi:hypothetical protein